MRKGLEKFGEVLDAAGNVVRPAGLVAAVGLAHAVFPKVDFEELGRPGLMDLDNAVIPSSGSDDIEWGEGEELRGEEILLEEESFSGKERVLLRELVESDKKRNSTARYFFDLVFTGRYERMKHHVRTLQNTLRQENRPDIEKDALIETLRITADMLIASIPLNYVENEDAPEEITLNFNFLVDNVLKGGKFTELSMDVFEDLCVCMNPYEGRVMTDGLAEVLRGDEREYVEVDIWLDVIKRFGEKSVKMAVAMHAWTRPGAEGWFVTP